LDKDKGDFVQRFNQVVIGWSIEIVIGIRKSRHMIRAIGENYSYSGG